MKPNEAVLFLHSTGTTPAMWAAVPDEVLGGRKKLTPANLGYPPHPPLARGASITLEQEVDHVLGSVPASVERLHVVAHSYGATVALAAVPRVRDALASLFLIEPVLFGSLLADPSTDPVIAAELRAFADEGFFDDAKGGGEEWLERFIDYWNRPGSWSRLPEAVKQFTRSMGWKMFQEVRLCFETETPFEAYAVDVPTTLALGERTTTHSRAVTHALARHLPNVTLVELAGTGHMAPLTHPKLVCGEIERHFSRLPR